MCSEGYSTWSIYVCVFYICLSVHGYSGSTGYGVAYEQYQHLQNNENMNIKKEIFPKRLGSGDMV